MIPEVIETPRLILRRWAPSDVAAVFGYATDEEWGRYLPVPQPYRESDARDFVAAQISLDGRDQLAWALQHETGVIGGINLRLFAQRRIAEIDYAIARAWWGRGLGTEAAAAVVDAAFHGIDELIRVRSMIDARNVASARVLEKVGLQREGLLRSNGFKRGEAIDEAWYAVLRTQWQDRASARR
ncbi:MAG: GNAT family N-acetyltransferase [Deltaproteobacteria bacterium]|nr:GNAT family N-acetyltransferase [Nannocystaceae bacterium]